MVRNIFIWGAAALVLALAGCQSGGGLPAAAPGQARKIVVFRPDAADTPAQEQALAATGAVRVKALPAVHAAVVLADPADAQALARDPRVLRVESDPIASAQVLRMPRNAFALAAETVPWGVRRIRANRVWDRDHDQALDPGGDAGAGVKVAVVDTGIDLSHPDLAPNIAGGYNAIDPSASPADDNGHGTHVAGIIAAAANGTGVIGVAPRVALYAVKVLDSRGNGYYSDIIAGIAWCIEHDMQVINLSLGGYEDVPILHDAIAQAAARGIVITAAAGNDGPGDDTVEYPAKYSEVIAVAAAGVARTLTDYSSRGPEVALVAPGDDILSTFPGNAYQTLSGTSMATPHVSGAAALVIGAGVTGADAVRARLRQAADHLAVNHLTTAPHGYGQVDAEKAVRGGESGQF